MYYSQTENKHITEYTQFTLGGITYPQQWLVQATPEQKAAIGLEEVVVTGSRADDRFYWVSENLVGASLTYTNTPKLLDDRNEVNEDGTPMLDEAGNQVVTKGLKSNWKVQVNQQVYTVLQPTDYIDLRNMRNPSYKPEWITWRDAVRTTAAAVKADIDACTTVEELINIVTNYSLPESPKE